MARVEYLGAERVIHGVLEGGRWKEAKVAARIPSTMTDPYGVDSVHVFVVAESHLKFFDRQSGRRAAPTGLSWQ